MASISRPARMPRRVHRSHDASLALVLTFLFLLGSVYGRSAPAQSVTDGEEFEFTHPLVAESPSPDTKVRFDFADASWREDATRGTERTYRLEAEYAFRPWVSIEVNVPHVTRGIAGLPTESGIGDAEAALKLASFALEPQGVLLGGGVEMGLPTGDAGDGIGSDHIVEVAPYVDCGYMRGPVELVGFMTMSFATNRRADEAAERALEYNVSGMLHLTPVVAGLLEVDGESPLAGHGSDATRFNLSPGILLHPRVMNGHLLVGISAGFPVTSAREFNRRLLVSAFYHF